MQTPAVSATPVVATATYLESLADMLSTIDHAEADPNDIARAQRCLDHGRTLPAPGGRVVIRSRGSRGEKLHNGTPLPTSRFDGEVGTLVEIVNGGAYHGQVCVRVDSLVRYAPMDVVYLPLLDVAALPRRCQCPPGIIMGDCPMSYANGAHEDGLTFGLTEDEYQATL